MSREKQIEEIAKVMCGGCADGKECMQCLCADWYRAEKLYNAGYRKQEVAKEIFDLIEDECLAYPIQEGHPTILVDARNYNELKKKYIGGDDHD